jgi:hypothetical protein
MTPGTAPHAEPVTANGHFARPIRRSPDGARETVRAVRD